MEDTTILRLYHADFNQFSLVTASTRPKSKSEFTKKFPKHNLRTNNEISPILDQLVIEFLQKSLPSTTCFPPQRSHTISIRLSKFKPVKIIDTAGDIKFAYFKRLETYRAPESLEFQQFSLCALWEDFEENLCIVNTRPKKKQIEEMRLKKLERLTSSTEPVKLGLLFDSPISALDAFPEGIEANITKFLAQFNFKTRCTGGNNVRCDFIGWFLKIIWGGGTPPKIKLFLGQNMSFHCK